MKRDMGKHAYYDVAQQKYIDEPKLEPRQKSKAELVADNSDWLIYTDENGHETHERSMYALTDNLLAYAEGPKKWGVKDIEDNIIIPAQFEELYVGGEDRFLIKTADQKNYGIIDIKGNWVIPFGKFDWLWFRGKYYLAEKDGKKASLTFKAMSSSRSSMNTFILPTTKVSISSLPRKTASSSLSMLNKKKSNYFNSLP